MLCLERGLPLLVTCNTTKASSQVGSLRWTTRGPSCRAHLIKHRRNAHCFNISQTCEFRKLHVRRPPPWKRRHRPKIFTPVATAMRPLTTMTTRTSWENRRAFSDPVRPDFVALYLPPSRFLPIWLDKCCTQINPAIGESGLGASPAFYGSVLHFRVY